MGPMTGGPACHAGGLAGHPAGGPPAASRQLPPRLGRGWVSFGEMTITPLDFSMLTGFPCGGTAIPFYRDIHRDPVFLTRCLGARFAESAMFSEQISVSALREFFRDYTCETVDDVDILTRAFLLFLLGSSLLSSVIALFTWDFCGLWKTWMLPLAMTGEVLDLLPCTGILEALLTG